MQYEVPIKYAWLNIGWQIWMDMCNLLKPTNDFNNVYKNLISTIPNTKGVVSAANLSQETTTA